MTILNETFTLENGVEIPKIGFGCWQIPEGETTCNAVTFALQMGYRHIDTARAYGNEASVGRAVRDSGIPRGDIFVTSKVPAEIKSYDGALDSFEQTMRLLDLGYLDLLLIHAPWPWANIGADFRAENKQVWKALEEIYRSGRCRAIGVSNFDVADLTSLREAWTIKPMVNQIKFYIGYTEEDVTRYCQANNILVEAYSPLATGRILDNPTIAAMAQKYKVSVPQICIRYTLQRGTLPLPKSTHREYIRQNAQLDFQIDAEDMRYLDSLKDTEKAMA